MTAQELLDELLAVEEADRKFMKVRVLIYELDSTCHSGDATHARSYPSGALFNIIADKN